MSRRPRFSQSDIDRLLDELHGEAFGPYGTWSARTLTEMLNLSIYFGQSDTESLVSRLVKYLNDDETKQSTKFKIGQLFNLLMIQQFPFFEQSIEPYIGQLKDAASKPCQDILWVPTMHFLQRIISHVCIRYEE